MQYISSRELLLTDSIMDSVDDLYFILIIPRTLSYYSFIPMGVNDCSIIYQAAVRCSQFTAINNTSTSLKSILTMRQWRCFIMQLFAQTVFSMSCNTSRLLVDETTWKQPFRNSKDEWLMLKWWLKKVAALCKHLCHDGHYISLQYCYTI
jgi:hypothetical protein